MTTTFRSLLFVPGARPDRFDKAAAAGADTIIIDLEDAVLPDDKVAAREAALAWLLEKAGTVRAGIRINSPRTADGCADIAALAAAGAEPSFIMVPKAETGIDMEIVSEALSRSNLVAVIESGRAVSNAMEIAAASAFGVLFGGADFSASLGADLSSAPAMNYARGAIASACGAAGVPAYDVPFLDISDEAGLTASTEQAKAFGFSGRACIHPKQVGCVTSVFTPTEAEISEANAIIAALESSNGGAVLHKGKLVDRPIILAAQRILSRA
ncbi:CoA ester lyase [Hyphomonas sp.]|uniref:HpcH/HpaI aldolase/citrate lyase family protein n=1 Tax=Hyphomonas sp. TaxID=87 RepID=UPI0025C65277|nr:CoA ester lyase [Hyphomonas sp.]